MGSNTSEKDSRLPGLNSLRFFAALLVIFHHGETIKRKHGLENFEYLGLFRNGGNAVSFFFVLSGFLITYLLLKERSRTGNVKIRHFYLKRALRIWPLYFLLVFVGTIGLPITFRVLNINYEMPYSLGQVWFYFVFFFPGLVTFIFGHHFLEPLWSIGVEEIFYMVWAPIFKLSKNKIVVALISVIALKVVLSIIGIYFVQNNLYNFLVNTLKFETMAIGGLGAYFIYLKGQSLSHQIIFKLPFQIIIVILILSYIFFHSNIDNACWNSVFKTPIVSSLIVCFLYLYLIICVSLVDNSIIKLRSKTLSFLGEISYGIYMYHMLIIFATIHFLKKYLIHMNSLPGLLVFYTIILSLTIALSALSKYLFENYFLSLKRS